MADFKHLIKNFSGGILEDKREQSPVHFGLTKHFDTFTYPTKLVPHVQTIASLGTASAGITTLGIVKFLYAQHLSATLFRLYGLGADDSGNVKLYVFDINGENPNITNWVAATNGESASGAVCGDVFFYYKGFIYTLSGNSNLNRYDTTEIASFADGYQTVSYTQDACQPLHCSSDDIAYFFGDNTVYSLDDTTWNGAVLQLPTNERITCRAEFGDYLAIGTVTVGALDVKSTVYLWDRDSSLETISARIDFGAGSLVHLANLNNKLIGVMSYYIDNAYSLNKGKVVIKEASGSFAVPLNEIITDKTSTSLPRTNYVKDDKLYFPMKAPLNGDDRLGIWAVDENGKAALDFVEPAATSYDGIFAIADIWWIAHSGNGSVTHSDATGTYSITNPSILETLILSTVAVTSRGTIIMNSATEKKLVGVTVMTEPLPATGKVICKYRRDNETDWTTIFTNTELNSINHSATNREDQEDEEDQPLGNYNEVTFHLESYGGAVVTGLEYGGEVVDTQKY